MSKKITGEIIKVLVSVAILSAAAGCSNRGAYESIQASNRFECSKLPPSQYEECIEDASQSYNDYEAERNESVKDQ